MVWSHPEGPIKGVQQVFPEAWKRIHAIAHHFADKKTNPYNDLVQADAKEMGVNTPFYVEHALDGDPVAEQIHGILGDVAMGKVISKWMSDHCKAPMVLANVCCNGCTSYRPDMPDEEINKMQLAAIKNNPI